MTPRWRVLTTPRFDRELWKLDRATQRRVLTYLHALTDLPDPGLRGKGLTADRRAGRTSAQHAGQEVARRGLGRVVDDG